MTTRQEIVNAYTIDIMELIKKTQVIPEIRALIYWECSDGKFRSIFGIPANVAVTKTSKIMGYCFVDRQLNVMYGKRFESEQAAKDFWAATKEKQNKDTAEVFMKFTIEKLESSLTFWKDEVRKLKGAI